MISTEVQPSTFRDYLRVLFRQKFIVIALFGIVTGSVIIGAKLQTPVYEAQVKMLISAKKQVEAAYYTELSGYNPAEKITVTQSEIVKSIPVLQRTVDALELFARPEGYERDFASPLKRMVINWELKNAFVSKLSPEEQRPYKFRLAIEQLKRAIEVQPLRDSNTFLIKVQDFDPVMAATIANTVSRSYVIYDLEQQLAEVQMKYGGKHPVVTQIRDNINKMYKTLSGTPIANIDAIGPASVKIIEQASVPIAPTGVSKKLLVLLAMAMSLVLGVILAFVFEYLDPTFKTLQEAEKILNVPVLGSIPQKAHLREVFQQNLADQMYLLMKDRNLKSIMLTSVEPLRTAPSIVADLAEKLGAKFPHPVLLIDADLRRPALTQILGAQDKPGLGEYLQDKASFQQVVRKVKQGLDLICAGKTDLNPLTLLDSVRMQELLETARKNYGVVFVMAPPASVNKDALILAEQVGGLVVLLDEAKTRREVAKFVLGAFEKKKVNILGSILSGRTFPIPRLIYNIF